MALKADNAGLPKVLPVFPLAGALLLPRGQLPLNIFEPRYLTMVRDAMAGDRLIGMVQPLAPDDGATEPDVYGLGCAGRITAFSETNDGRFLITLTGVSRFRVVEELSTTTPYRQVVADFVAFAEDQRSPVPEQGVDRDGLIGTLKRYLDARGLTADWEAIGKALDETLVNSLAMICPFEPAEKQALLESASLKARTQTMIALMEIGLAGAGEEGDPSRH